MQRPFYILLYWNSYCTNMNIYIAILGAILLYILHMYIMWRWRTLLGRSLLTILSWELWAALEVLTRDNFSNCSTKSNNLLQQWGMHVFLFQIHTRNKPNKTNHEYYMRILYQAARRLQTIKVYWSFRATVKSVRYFTRAKWLGTYLWDESNSDDDIHSKTAVFCWIFELFCP